MIKFPYVIDYSLFERVELGLAGDLLQEYNDFYAYNKAQVGLIDVAKAEGFMSEAEEDAVKESKDEKSEKAELSRAEHNAAAATNHYVKLFGNGDFAESTLVGLKLDFYDLQQILLEEYKAKTPITESQMNEIAPMLRRIASALIFAERMVTGVNKLRVDLAGLNENEQNKARVQNEKVELAIEFIKDGFRLLLERMHTEEVEIPEYTKIKLQIKKMKNVEAHIDFCETLFFGAK